jgi:hypothetical protein
MKIFEQEHPPHPTHPPFHLPSSSKLLMFLLLPDFLDLRPLSLHPSILAEVKPELKVSTLSNSGQKVSSPE